MMKRILCSLTAFLLLLGVGEARAQQQATVSIPEVVGEAGTTVSVPINVTNFTNVGSIQLAIEFDEDVLTFESTSNFAGSGLQANATDGVLRLAFASLDAIDIASGRLVDINFTFEGGTADLTFDTGESEITDVDGTPINTTFDSGFVAEQAISVGFGTISNVEEGDTVRVPLAALDAVTGVGAVSLVVQYDSDVLAPTDDILVNVADGFDDILAASPSAGQINIEGYSTAGLDLDGTFAELEFVAQGGSTHLTFGSESQLATLAGETINIRFRSGSVIAAGAEVGTISIPDQDLQAGGDIVVPVEVDSIGNVGSVTLAIMYDPGVLSFQEATDFDAFGSNNSIVNSPEPGEIRLVGFSTAGVELADVLANLHFSYTGGDTEVAFDESVSVVSTPAGDPIFVQLEDGSVSELTVVTIAEARAMELESQVAVEGVVTRAMGRNIWIQDETAAIMLFSFDAGEFPVEGEVAKGHRLRVSGELTEFNDLLEILPDTIEVLEEGVDLPAPQEVTVAELNADCEEYQSELVTIDTLRFTVSTDEFEPITTDEEGDQSLTVFTQVDEEITMRIQRPSDTELVGYTFDENAFEFQGVVGQFRDDCQLMPVEQADIVETFSVANDPRTQLPQEFALHGNYPNPFNPSTTINFDLPAPADVTVSVYDVIGREVMTVPMGRVAPGAKQQVKLDASELGSGVYLYRVTAVSGDETHAGSGRMVLVK